MIAGQRTRPGGSRNACLRAALSLRVLPVLLQQILRGEDVPAGEPGRRLRALQDSCPVLLAEDRDRALGPAAEERRRQDRHPARSRAIRATAATAATAHGRASGVWIHGGRREKGAARQSSTLARSPQACRWTTPAEPVTPSSTRPTATARRPARQRGAGRKRLRRGPWLRDLRADAEGRVKWGQAVGSAVRPAPRSTGARGATAHGPAGRPWVEKAHGQTNLQ